MSKDDNAGLFSKVVKFVKNPTTSWAELDAPESDRESGYSKQMLKEMIERKRRNDFVRKREFDMLRKLRRSEAMAGHDPGARPSFFQSSMPSKPDDRATTLKKIDEIEAQMSMQWWKTKHGGPGSVGPTSSQFASSHMPLESEHAPLTAGSKQAGPYDTTEPQPLAPTEQPKAQEPQEMLSIAMLPGLGPQAPASPAGEPAAPLPSPAALRPAGMAAAAGRPALSPFASTPDASTGFSASKLFAIEIEEFAHDPELEEAAIRFANGDDEGAEAGLREVLAPGGARADHDETWLTLFDLYRAVGQQERFESAAIEFAARLGRSAPQWFSMPELVARSRPPGASAPLNAAGTGAAPLAHWTSPAVMGTQTVAAMMVGLAKATPPWKLNWTKLTSIEEGAVEGLTRVFAQWSDEPVQLRFIGIDALEQVLREATPSGDRTADPRWWKLRMAALRLMHRPDEFELVALDYCVTYEVSPPSWERSRCDYKQLESDGSYVPGHTIVGDAFHDSLSSATVAFGDSQGAPSTQMAQVSSIELGGQVLGDAAEMMELLDSKLQGADIVVISCARLIRIDFTAAGSLLNWVSSRQAEGRQVQFVDVHRLIAAFFNVIGIAEHARVIARTH